MKDTLLHILRVIVAGLVAGLAFGVVVGLFGWISGWKSALEFSNGLFVAGSAIIIFGLLSAWGGFTSRGNFALTYTQTASDMNLTERAKWTAIEVMHGYNVVGTGTVVGLVLIGLSVLAYTLFG
ncbi:MAG: hypothetical protein HYZ25_21380 [Chloroflexi bacterium]|nr:hypothetical protein [Chloroflexota bacterium]